MPCTMARATPLGSAEGTSTWNCRFPRWSKPGSACPLPGSLLQPSLQWYPVSPQPWGCTRTSAGTGRTDLHWIQVPLCPCGYGRSLTATRNKDLHLPEKHFIKCVKCCQASSWSYVHGLFNWKAIFIFSIEEEVWPALWNTPNWGNPQVQILFAQA